MRLTLWVGLGLLLLGSGCASAPSAGGPGLVTPWAPTVCRDNPIFVGYGTDSYGTLFEKSVLALQESGFEIAETNRYDGRVETFPRTAPGLGQPWIPGSSDVYDRLLYTCQSYRHRASLKILPADNGKGFFIQVVVFRELEDLPRPTRSTTSAVIFRSENNIDRKFEVVDPSVLESNWIPMGRDPALEQVILQRLREEL